MAEEDSSDDDQPPGLTADLDSDSDGENEDDAELNKQNDDAEIASETSSTAGGFIRKEKVTESRTKLRPKRPIMTWEEINRKLEIQFGSSSILSMKPTDDDVNLVVDFQENTEDEDTKALADLWLSKFQVAMDTDNFFRKSNRLHLKEIEKVKSPEIVAVKPKKLVLNGKQPSVLTSSTDARKLTSAVPLNGTSTNRFDDPTMKAKWKVSFETAFKTNYYKSEVRDNR